MNRRALGRGRLIVALAATLVVAGCLPAWWTVGGNVTPAFSGNGFEGMGIVVFLAAVGMLALIVLPYASREDDSRIDRAWSYALLAAVAIGAYALRLLQIQDFGGLGLPDRAPGLWVTGVSLLLLVWGVVEMLGERPAEY